MLIHSDYDVIVGFQRTLIILLFILMIIGLWYLAVLFLKKASSLEMKSQKQYLMGTTLFAFLMGLGRLLFLYHDYFADDSLDLILWKLGNSISIFGLSCLAYVIESFIISKTKKIFTYIGLISAIFLIAMFGLKIAFIFFRFIQLLTASYQDFMIKTFQIFELSTAFLFMSAFILFEIFQRQLRSRAGIGYGWGPFPYFFFLFGLVYPIANILSLMGVPFQNNETVLVIMEILSIIAAILEILLFFDLIRRFDNLSPFPTENEDDDIKEINLKIKGKIGRKTEIAEPPSQGT